jgi:serine protease DegS
VLRDGPADKAGILPGDVLRRINGIELENARSAMTLIAQSGPDSELVIEGTRAGKPFSTNATTSPRPAQ